MAKTRDAEGAAEDVGAEVAGGRKRRELYFGK